MALTRDQFLEVMNNERYPRSSKYDPDWILENMMGSHCLWLQESLAGQMNLRPGMHVFDLGCGKAISSIFLAKEFDVKVWAADLWNSPTENWQRIREAGVADKVFPIYADAHSLPFAEGYFDHLPVSYFVFPFPSGSTNSTLYLTAIAAGMSVSLPLGTVIVLTLPSLTKRREGSFL